MTITIGSAPDSWGVWFPDDPDQTPADRFLREVTEAGYEWIELGPHGYLPTDAAGIITHAELGRGEVDFDAAFAALADVADTVRSPRPHQEDPS